MKNARTVAVDHKMDLLREFLVRGRVHDQVREDLDFLAVNESVPSVRAYPRTVQPKNHGQAQQCNTALPEARA